ncbi:hypothetical protein [Brevundimonas lenta]|uniref:Uncharacterized protein n=1 Tax=Brevundimonas lenta TaxID=424796 RepID=A0A7W6NRI2_9CAUL|nr:hypothetical protein [Brevundimonas lenta]MBB4084287.1 hypothetical protein [Brevundimonas lenta]
MFNKKSLAVAIGRSGVRVRRHVDLVVSSAGRVSAPPPSPLSAELTAFIEGAVPSVWALETLLLLRGAPDAAWTADRVVAELRASPRLVHDCLDGLQRAGLVVGEDGVFRYAPASRTLGDLSDALEAAYRERPVAVVNTIATRRPDPLKGFADSFRFGGWKS